jgi:putative flippase GtrA
MIFTEFLQIRPVLSNVISWVIAVLFAFVTNRTWVFDGKTANRREFLQQLVKFMGARAFTLLVEEVILFIFVEKMEFSNLMVKITAQAIVIILNYIFSKVWIF